MRKSVILVLVLLSAVSMFAATGKSVTYKSGDETVTGQLFTPEGKGPFPALVVIHEWWGLNDWVNEQASKLADQGYVTLAVDLYRGKVAKTSDEAHELMRGVPQDRAQKDLLAAFDFLAQQSSVKKEKIGTIGWCMGGGYALDLALAQSKIAATVINYGHLMTEPASLQKIKAPVLGIFGAQDRGIPVDMVRKFEKDLKAQGKSVDIVIYDDAGHAFENPNNKDGYRAADAQDAWNKTIAFLARNLKTARTQ
jgi:carboxymethylenebutenolidase